MKKAFFCVAAALMVGACSNKQLMEGNTAVAPAAEGTVQTEKVRNNNTKVDITVKHLASADKLMAGATNYIVWIVPKGAPKAINIGALQVNKDLEGRYETTVPYPQFRLYVTPESSTVAQEPRGPVVFEKDIGVE